MANNIIESIVEIEEYEDDNEIDRDDFTFIIGPDGDLKSMIIPERLMDDPPEEVKMILEMFGIDDIHDLNNRLLH
jgi:hypothetical protein